MDESEARIRKRITAKNIRKVSDGLLSTLFDTTLFLFSLPVLSIGKRATSYDVHRTFDEAHALISDVNFQQFKQCLYNLRKQGLIESFKDWVNKPLITQLGKERLQHILPVYDTKRPWTGKIYLISYDFGIAENHHRDLFRKYIKRFGAIKLQESLFVCCNDPYNHITDFKKLHGTQGVILVSELGKRGFIGEENLKTFLWYHAKLDEVNGCYQEFIDKFRNIRSGVSPAHVYLSYYSILKDDPQLPYQLLPDEYLGDEAYLLFQGLTKISKFNPHVR